MKHKTVLILISAFLILFSSCNSTTEKLTFLVTTDIHGAFFSTDPITGEALKGSMAHVSQYIKQIENPEGLVLLDNGDIIQGDPSAYYYNFENTQSRHLFTRIMNKLNYDAATVGNHDIEAGHDVYDRINHELTIPWLAANCVNTKTGEPYFGPYTIIKRGQVKIAVLGLTTPGIPDWLPENIWSGMEFHDMIESARHWIPIIQENEKPDLIIGLFHSGLEYTYNNQTADTEKNENAVRLVAQQVAGFDLLFAGHDHKTWNEYQLNPDGDSVLILGSQSRGRQLSKVEVIMQKNKGDWHVNHMSGENIYLGDLEPDPEYAAYFSQEYKEVKEYVNQEVAELNTALESKDAFFGPSKFMTLIHQVQLGISKADISFAAPLAFNSVIESGMLKVDDLFDLYRFENLLYTMELSGQEILDYLNYSYGNWFNTMTKSSDHLIRMKVDKNGFMRTSTAYYNFESAQGINYTVNVAMPKGEQVSIQKLSNGELFALDKTYKVAINSYRGNGGGGHLTRGAGIAKEDLAKRIITSTDKDLRYYMKSWMQEEKIIHVETVENWRVIPEDLYQAGKTKDYRILFRN